MRMRITVFFEKSVTFAMTNSTIPRSPVAMDSRPTPDIPAPNDGPAAFGSPIAPKPNGQQERIEQLAHDVDKVYELASLMGRTLAQLDELPCSMQRIVDYYKSPEQEADLQAALHDELPDSLRCDVPTESSIDEVLMYCLNRSAGMERVAQRVKRMAKTIGMVSMLEEPFGLMKLDNTMLLQAAQREIKMLEREVEVQGESIVEKDKLIDELRGQIKTLVNNAEQKEQSLQKKRQSALAELKKHTDAKDKIIKELREQLEQANDTAEQKVQILQKMVQTALTDNDYDNQIPFVENDKIIKELRGQLKTLVNNAVQKHQAQTKKLREAVAELERKNKEYSSTIVAKDKIIKELRKYAKVPINRANAEYENMGIQNKMDYLRYISSERETGYQQLHGDINQLQTQAAMLVTNYNLDWKEVALNMQKGINMVMHSSILRSREIGSRINDMRKQLGEGIFFETDAPAEKQHGTNDIQP